MPWPRSEVDCEFESDTDINDCFTDETNPDYFGYNPTHDNAGIDANPYLHANKGHNQYTHTWVDSADNLEPTREYDLIADDKNVIELHFLIEGEWNGSDN